MNDHTGVIIGCLISLLSSVLTTLGYVVQKIGHMKAIEKNWHYIREPFWILGIFLIIVSIPIFSLSLMFASQTAMSMIPTLSILIIMFWSWLLLNEKLTRYDFFAIAFLFPGTIVILLSSDVAESDLKNNAFSYIFSNNSLVFLAIIMGIFVFGGIISMHILYTHSKMNAEINEQLAVDSVEDEKDAHSRNDSIISGSEILSYRWNLIPLLYLPWFAGLFCCLASTLIKSLFMIYKHQLHSNKNIIARFGEPDVILLVLNICFLTFISFYLLNKSLQYFEPIYVLPFEKVSLMINTLLWGGIILQEFEELTVKQAIGFIIGAIIWCLGVGILLWKKDLTAQMDDFMHEEIKEYKHNSKKITNEEQSGDQSTKYSTSF